MAETTAEVRRDIELTRERMSSTLTQLEQKLNLTQVVKDHPWPAIAMAVGAGILLSGSRADVKATAATLAATKGTSNKLGPVLDDLVAQLMTGVQVAFQSRVESWVDDIKGAIGAPATASTGAAGSAGSGGSGGYATPGTTGAAGLGATGTAGMTGTPATSGSADNAFGRAD